MITKFYKIEWREFDARCRRLARKILRDDTIKDIYGISRGGLPIAVRLSHLTRLPLTETPKSTTTVIVDDILDSGSTRESFKNFKHFEVLVNKKEEDIKEWVIFPWEKK